jgi:hypothetical protein
MALLLWPTPVFAKEIAIHSPSGRRIYDQDETFEAVLDQNRRRFIVEVAAGAGPEGNLAMSLGWLVRELKGLELYAGVGLEVNPAVHWALSARYLMNFGGYRPYVGAGYFLNHLTALETISHNVFVEAGYSWVIHRTFHVTIGVGVRRLLTVVIDEDSPLEDPDIDRAFLDEQLANIDPWLPTVALRFSRAF